MKPTAKELERARSLLDIYRLTLEQGKYVVDFSFKVAKKTGFSIQNFGGIVQYAEPALSEFQITNSKLQDQDQLETSNSQPSFNFAADLDTIDQRGKELLDGLPEADRRDLMGAELQFLRESDKWNVYAKWETSVLTEHLEMLAGRRLALGEA